MQNEKLDNLMYYDARPGGMNGLFCTDDITVCLKGYYPFYAFNQLYRQGDQVSAESEDPTVWVCAAKGDEQNVMITYYDDNDAVAEKEKTVKVTFNNAVNPRGIRLEYYLLDETHDCELIREEIFTSQSFASYITLPLNSTYLLKIVKI